jgi:hypothetical protein
MEKLPKDILKLCRRGPRGYVETMTALSTKIDELVDAINKLSDAAEESAVLEDGIHSAGGPYFEVVYKGEVVNKVKGKSNAEEAYEKLLAAE